LSFLYPCSKYTHRIQPCLPTLLRLVLIMARSKGANPSYCFTSSHVFQDAYASQPSRLIKLSSTSPINKFSKPELDLTEPRQDTSRNPFSLHILSVDQQNLSPARIADYLEDSTTSHVEPHHTSSQESARIYAERLSYFHKLDNILRI
jgi:hypothetical protein